MAVPARRKRRQGLPGVAGRTPLLVHAIAGTEFHSSQDSRLDPAQPGPILSGLGTPKAPPYCISNLSSFFGETSGLPVPLLFVSESRIVLGPTVESAANVQFVLERALSS